MTADQARAALWASFIRNRNVDAGTARDGALAVAGGYALFVRGSLLQITLGAGTVRPLREDDLAAVEQFFGARGAPARFELDEGVRRAAGTLLQHRGYVDEGLRLAAFEGPSAAAAHPSAATVRTADRRAWLALALRAHEAEGPDRAQLRRTLELEAVAAHVLTIATLDGQDAGVAALDVSDDLGLLFGAGVLPAARGRGVHRALLAARMALAAERGASRVSLLAVPDGPAARSAQAAGLIATGFRYRVVGPSPD